MEGGSGGAAAQISVAVQAAHVLPAPTAAPTPAATGHAHTAAALEPQVSVSRLALERAAGAKPVFYCWTAEEATALAAPEFGGRGAAAAASSGTVVGDDGPARCKQRLFEMLDCQAEQINALVRLASGPVPLGARAALGCVAGVPCPAAAAAAAQPDGLQPSRRRRRAVPAIRRWSGCGGTTCPRCACCMIWHQAPWGLIR